MNNVEDFMAKLAAQQAPMTRNSQKSNEKKIEKFALNFQGNFGRYQILPVDNVVTDTPFVTLFNTYEICIPRSYKGADGQEENRPTWVKILPKDGYVMKDQTGRTVSSLTNEEDNLLYQARTLFDELYKEMDVKNNIDTCKDLIRRRNYTIFHGFCVNKWAEDNQGRQPDKSNFSGLFISTAKGFINEVTENINNKKFETGDESLEWLKGIYNRQTEGRTGCIMMTIGKAKVGVGFDVNVNHIISQSAVKNAIIPEEDMALMQDPVAAFLGWQAKHDEENTAPEYRRLFNASLIKEAIEYMTATLAAYRAGKAAGNGLSTEELSEQAKTITTNAAASQVMPQSNDPMIQQAPAPNMANIQANNNAPFQTAPVFHADPTTGAPVNVGMGQPQQQPAFAQQAAPFSAPQFANFGNQQAQNAAPANNNMELPF